MNHRGNQTTGPIFWEEDGVLMSDNAPWTCMDGVPIKSEERPCGHCGLTADGFHGVDPCLGHLPSVRAACCGHGVVGYGYIAFDNGVLLRGEFSVEQPTDDQPDPESVQRTCTKKNIDYGEALARLAAEQEKTK